MFTAFQPAGAAGSTRRLALSAGASLLLYALLGGAVLLAAARMHRAVQERPKETEVVFRPPPPPPAAPAKPEPAPPPPLTRPKRVIQAARRVTPAPTVEPAPLVAPKDIPAQQAPESQQETVQQAPIAVGGRGQLVPGGVAASDDAASAPINLPENATPPTPLPTNMSPDYPGDARSRGMEGLVILKIVVLANGGVGSVQVLRGEEPFIGAAVAAVRAWRFTPALVAGQPASVYRIIKVPFRLRN